jgi:hypothetical protein
LLFDDSEAARMTDVPRRTKPRMLDPRRSTAATAAGRGPCGDVSATVLVEPAADRPGRRHQPVVMDWFGYKLDFAASIDRPVLGSIIFWCGWVFLRVRGRRSRNASRE